MTAPAANEKATNRDRELIAFMSDPASYPHGPRRVRLLQTHASWVFVAAPFVYKIKKPVNFGFLDFSTLAKRKHFCEREIELNRRLNPDMYLDVATIVRRAGRLHIGAGGRATEYAVRMKKLSDGRFLDRLILSGESDCGDLDRVVAKLKTFYRDQQPSDEVSGWGEIDRLRISTDENFEQTRPFVGQTISQPSFDAIGEFTNGFYRRHARDFARRVRERRVLDCHGDLHLQHIHLTPRQVHIFDCIEFNDRFRYLDVANEIAFLAMDLDHHGRPDLGRHFATAMATELDDPGLLDLLDFYKCYRACVRGKVESFHSVSPGLTARERLECVRRAREYFQLALRYAVAGSKPQALAIMGRIGTGKSALAEALGAELGWNVYSSDRLRKQIAGAPLTVRGDAETRRKLYSSAMTSRTYAALFDAAKAQFSSGRSAILDATFSRARHRAELCARAPGTVRFVVATAPDRVIQRRLRSRDSEGGCVSDARSEDYTALNAAYEPPEELPPGQRVRVGCATTPADACARALKALVRQRLKAS